MNTEHKDATGFEGKPVPKAKRPKITVYKSEAELSRLLRTRYHSLFHRYRERTLALMPLIISGGKNSYNEFVAKSDAVNKSTDELRSYCRGLTAEFQIDKPYDAGQITSLVCRHRSLNKLAPFTGRGINAKCLNELYNLFVVKTDIKTAAGGNYKVYTPVFTILAE